jgi:hypothetical protein
MNSSDDSQAPTKRKKERKKKTGRVRVLPFIPNHFIIGEPAPLQYFAICY